MENTHVLPPGPKGLPFLGNILQFRHDQLNYLHALQRTYGNMATIYIGKTPVVILFRPEHVCYILTENPRNFTNREVAGGLIFGNMLVLSLLARNFTDEVTGGLEALFGVGLRTTEIDFNNHDQRTAEKRDAGDVLSMLLHAQDEDKMMTREQVRNQLMTLIAAGHETTTNSLLWTFYLLSEHQAVREKLLSEIQTVLAGRDAKM